MSSWQRVTDPAYQAAVDYLYRFLHNSRVRNLERARFFTLDRMHALMDALDHPERAYPIVHIAGTNGKGSVAAMVASVLQHAGFRVGLYTSPHLVDFIERIRIDGVPIAAEDVVQGVERLRGWAEAHPEVSTFELATALAFDYFARQGVDWAVVEVGLGGRVDATNVVLPEVAVITAIDYDHMAVLGPTLRDIAREKAGIIKPQRPAVSASQRPEALAVLREVAQRRAAPFFYAPEHLQLDVLADTPRGQHLRFRPRQGEPIDIELPLLGPYQRENALAAVQAIRVLQRRGVAIPLTALQQGLRHVHWPCRFELLHDDPPLVVDGAHTPAAARALGQGLRHYFPERPWVVIFGVSRTKDPQALLRALGTRAMAQVVATQSIHPKAMAVDRVVQAARALGLPTRATATVEEALAAALATARRVHGVVVAMGSLFVAAGVRVAWTGEPWWRAPLRSLGRAQLRPGLV